MSRGVSRQRTPCTISPALGATEPTLRVRQRNGNPRERPARLPARPGTGASSPADSYWSHRRSRGSSPRHSRTLMAPSARPRGGIQPVDLALVVFRGCVFLILVVDRVLVVAAIGRRGKTAAGRHLARSLVVACRH